MILTGLSLFKCTAGNKGVPQVPTPDERMKAYRERTSTAFGNNCFRFDKDGKRIK